MKRYFMEYDNDKVCCGSNSHVWGFANSIATCKAYIKRCKEHDREANPRNFRIYDTQGELVDGFAPCVYSE